MRIITEFYCRYKYFVYKYNSICRKLIRGILYPCFYGDVINKGQKFKSDTFILLKSLRKSYSLTTTIDSLRHIFFAKDIDNQLVQLLGRQCICISFHILSLLLVQCLVSTNWWYIYCGLSRRSVISLEVYN